MGAVVQEFFEKIVGTFQSLEYVGEHTFGLGKFAGDSFCPATDFLDLIFRYELANDDVAGSIEASFVFGCFCLVHGFLLIMLFELANFWVGIKPAGLT